jgi:pullulanase
LHYTTPEGSYATDPNGAPRIVEFREMVKSLNESGLRVVMDVVYNHTFRSTDSHFEHLVPGYYFRQDEKGQFSNGSGCGNETASNRCMMRKLMVDSLVHWAKEYHVDGFRFDLMGLHDLETMREIRKALDRVDRSILLYGEGWTGGDSPLPPARRAVKTNVRKLDRVAAFSDTIRDALKGPVWDKAGKGFVNGGEGLEEAIKAGVVASTPHPQVKYAKGDAWKGPWASGPGCCVTYDSCHDNHALWDKLELGTPGAKDADLVRVNKLVAAIVLTSQGISFLHAGEEIARAKQHVENSYNASDAVNRIDWSRKARYRALFEYYRGLIALRKAHPAFRLRSAEAIRKSLRFARVEEPGFVAFVLKQGRQMLAVVYNATKKDRTMLLPAAGWGVLADGTRAGAKPFRRIPGAGAVVAAGSALVLIR